MKIAGPILRIAILAACGLLVEAGPAGAGEEGEGAASQAVAEPPCAWLAPYAAEPTSEDAFTTLRERLFRTERDADLIRGLTWLANARTQAVRVAAARGLADAYLLGEQLGADPVPGIRACARDPDPFVRTQMLSALAMHDSPLARELLFAHHAGDIPVPDGDAGEKIRTKVAGLLARYATADELSRLQQLGEGAQRAWFDDAEDHPAAGRSHRFETGEIQVGEEHRIELRSAPGTFLWFGPVRTAYGTDGWVGSGDNVTVHLGAGGGGWTSGASIYGGGISSIAGPGSAITHRRHLGDGRMRYWIRVSPSGRAFEHPRHWSPH